MKNDVCATNKQRLDKENDQRDWGKNEETVTSVKKRATRPLTPRISKERVDMDGKRQITNDKSEEQETRWTE